MNLFFRLIWLAIVARFRTSAPVLGPCRTPFRVLPTDLDVLRHMNNGVYFSLMDLARVDLMLRSGLFAKLRARGWYPVATAETIQFRRSLKLFERFDIVTRVVTWDDRAIVTEQRFERRGEVVARALVRARFLQRGGGTVPTAELLDIAGVDASSPPVPPIAADARWTADYASWLGDATPVPARDDARPTAAIG